MKQTLHIIAKDARRFWPEIAILIVTTAAFARIYPNQWLTPGLYAVSGWGGFAGPQGLQLLATVLAVLVPVSWLLLIARVIHGESLVGDRQFWLTRPYEWKQLLAAKCSSCLSFCICHLWPRSLYCFSRPASGLSLICLACSSI